MAGKTIYVGGLPGDVRRSEVEDLFDKYGKIRDVDLKTPLRPPAFAFIEFAHSRDAEDAVDGRDGYDFDGNRLRVEIAQGGGQRAGGGPPPMFGGPPPMMGRGFGGGRGGGISRRTGYRVSVTGLPKSASWQDLKDHMRRAGDVTFAQVFSDRYGMVGVVDFAAKDDMKYALRKLDDSEFKNPFERCYIRVKEDRSGGSRSRSRSRGRSHSRSRSRSRSYSSRSRSRSDSRSRSVSSRSRSRSRSKSASRSRSKSRDKSRSRSGSPAKSKSASPAANGAASPVDD